MFARGLCVFFSLVLVACGNNAVSSIQPTDPSLKETESLGSSIFKVTKKSCGSENLPVSKNERFQFENGVAAYVFELMADLTKSCNQALVFNRIIQQSSSTTLQSVQKYSETSNLVPQQKRTVCRTISGGEVLTDETTQYDGNVQLFEIDLEGDSGAIQWRGSPLCPGDILRFEVNKGANRTW